MKHDLHVSTAEAWEMGERRPTQEQSLALWEKSKTSGASGKVARDRLCYIYRPLVEAVVLRGFAKRNSPLFDDLVQAGYVGLLEAIDHYDPTMGVIFSSYCWSRVDWQLKASHTQMMNVVSFSVRDGKLRRKAFAVRNRLHTQLGREPSVEEIAALCDAPTRKVAALMAAGSVSADSIREDGSISLVDQLCAPGLSPEEALEISQMARYTTGLISHLTPKQQGVVVEHLGLGGHEPKTFNQIAEERGQCRQNPSGHFRKAMDELRQVVKA